ncbi:hypothetical protein C2S51_028707 [Perilla frutescens var. frutescens]|nr:hypothetical protein C2S51_028707 [Perilla frutescens var. frutescens]
MVISTAQQEIMPAVEPLLRKVVIEEFQKLFPGGTRNDVPEERILFLKFLDEVLDPVHTSKELRGRKKYPLQVALLDETGQIVTCGPESSALVEIVLADASGKDGEHDVTHGNSERRIIKTEDKEKPHFAKSVNIDLKKGIGDLIDVKLGQPSHWTKNCKCSLGVRLAQKLKGITVQEAWTAPFEVKDNRCELYKNHDPPSLSSEVWRLKEIGRAGKPRGRLEEEKIKTVQDLLFWLSVNREGLQKILRAGDIKWKTIVEHAQTCNIDDKRIFCHESSTEPQMGVIYDAVGDLKGVINESHFVPIDNLSADKKDHARKLLSSVLERSAFVERYKTFFDDEASLLQRYPYKSSDISASTNSSIQQSWNGNDPNIYQPTATGAGSSSQSLSPGNYEYFGGFGCFDDDPCWGMDDAMIDHNRLLTATSPNPMILYASCVDYSNNIQTYSHANESNADAEIAAPVEPQAVNKSNPPKRWKRVFCVMAWYSISKRVLDVTPKQKRQKVG